MSTRTVRLDDDAERALREVRRETGMTISAALKRGLMLLQAQIASERRSDAWTVYERLDLGAGGYLKRPARESRRGAREAIRDKHRR